MLYTYDLQPVAHVHNIWLRNNARYLKNPDDLTSGSVYALALKIGNDPIDIL